MYLIVGDLNKMGGGRNILDPVWALIGFNGLMVYAFNFLASLMVNAFMGGSSTGLFSNV